MMNIKPIDLPFLFSFIIIVLFYFQRPSYNFDVTSYIAAVLTLDGHNDSETHRLSYQALENSLSKDDFDLITGQNPYIEFRNTMYADSTSFNEIKSAHHFKFLYTSLSWFLYKIGVPIITSTYAVSILFFLLLISTFYLILRKNTVYNPVVIGFIALTIATSPILRKVAVLSTPDMLSAYFTFIVCYLFYRDKNTSLILGILILCVAIRPDNLILSLLITVSLLLSPKAEMIKLIFGGLSLFLVYFLLKWYSSYPGWATWFYHAFIEKQAYPISDPPLLSLSLYIDVLKMKILLFIFPFCLLITMSIIYFHKMNFIIDWNNKGMQLIAILILVFITRFFLFPAWDWRFYFVYYLILLTLFLFETNNNPINKIIKKHE